jgi:acyl carrier protein
MRLPHSSRRQPKPSRGDRLELMLWEEVKRAFTEALELPAETDVEALEIGADPHWDSVGHMALVAELENRFGIVLETDDMIDMSSYAKVLEIVRRHGVEV